MYTISVIIYQMQDTGDDIPRSLRFIRGESESRHGGANGLIVASVGGSRLIVASVLDKVICGRIALQT